MPTMHNCDGEIGKLLAPYVGGEPGWYIWLARWPLTIKYCPVCGEELPNTKTDEIASKAVDAKVVTECRDIALKFARLCKSNGLLTGAAAAQQIADLIEARFS